MKLQNNINSIQKSNDFVESNYSIEATAKAFSILSDGLYSNKVKAVIRELSTNAYDSHIAAGCKDKPFSLTLPNRLDNTFSVRDYGTGLSQEDCMSLYTTYFRSNKTDSNDAVGCLGLGSKSPFAYTDQFMVESFFNGKHMTFSAYKNESDAPVFAMIGTQDTDEPNGLKVSFSTKSDDRYKFIAEAESLYVNFEVVPDCNQTLDIERPDVIIEGDNWKVLSKTYENSVIMGQISYPIDEYEFDGEAYNLLSNCAGIQLVANIGEIDITPSRESLSYNSRTKTNLHNLFVNTLKEIGDQIGESVAECKTLWKARLKAAELENKLSKVKGLSDKIKEIEFWNGETLFSADYSGLSIEIEPSTEGEIIRFSKSRWRQKVERDISSKISVFTTSKFAIMFENIKRGSVGRIKQLLQDEWEEGNIFLIRGDESYLATVLNKLGADREDVQDVSELPAPPKSNGSSYRSIAKGCSVLTRRGQCDWVVEEAKVSVKEQDAFYITASREQIVSDVLSGSRMCFVSTLRRELEVLEQAGIDVAPLDKKIFILTPSAAKTMKLSGRSNWTDGMEYLALALEDALENNRHMFHTDQNTGVQSWSIGDSTMRWDTMFAIAKEISTSNPFKDFAELAATLSLDVTERALVRVLTDMARSYGKWSDFIDTIAEDDVDLSELYETMANKYPMLPLIDNVSSPEDIKTVANYIDTFKESE